MKTQIIPVVIGLIEKGPNKVTCTIPGNNNTNEIQKITMLGTVFMRTKYRVCRTRISLVGGRTLKSWVAFHTLVIGYLS